MGEELVRRIVTEIAHREGIDPIEVTPNLADSIDVEALETLFRGTTGSVKFDFAGYEVEMDHQGTITVSSLEAVV